jgi:chaperonin GroES
MSKFKTTITPIYDRIVVKRDEVETKSAGGILLATVGEKPTYATVLAVGSGRKIEGKKDLAPLSVTAGDRIVMGKYSGTEIKLDGEDLVVIREDDVLAVLGE